MFSEELKKNTRAEHAGLEKELVARIKKIQDVNDYVNLLRLMYGYYKPLQDRLDTFADKSVSAENFSLRISDSILNDLHELNVEPGNDIPVCPDIPEISTPASSMGAMYVTEGSTLGGQVITKMISRQLNLSPEKGFTFFNAYGDETFARWERFKEILNRPRNEEEKSEVMDAAKMTFSKFKEWIDLNARN